MQLLNVEIDEWEIAVDRVVLQDVIGRGAFGAVWRALLRKPNGENGNRTVAAKCFTRKIMYEYQDKLHDELCFLFCIAQILCGRHQCFCFELTYLDE